MLMAGPDKILRDSVRPTFFGVSPQISLPLLLSDYSSGAPSAEAAKNASTSAMLWVRR